MKVLEEGLAKISTPKLSREQVKAAIDEAKFSGAVGIEYSAAAIVRALSRGDLGLLKIVIDRLSKDTKPWLFSVLVENYGKWESPQKPAVEEKAKKANRSKKDV